MKENSLRSWDWMEEEGAGILSRNSILDVEEDEGDKGEKSGSKCAETGGESEEWIGESEGKRKDIDDTVSYLEGKENLSSDMGKEI